MEGKLWLSYIALEKKLFLKGKMLNFIPVFDIIFALYFSLNVDKANSLTPDR